MTDLHVEQSGPEEAVLRLRLDDPATLNAMTDTMTDALTHELEQAVGREDIRVVEISGAPGAFSAGAAITGEDPVSHFDISALDRANRLVRAVVRLDKPVVAVVDGIAAGVAASLAVACDLQVCSERASFLMAFARIGLTTDGGSSATLAASMGRAHAMRMALLAEPMSAAEACAAGLVSHCVPQREFEETVTRVLSRLAAGPPLSHAASKKLINSATLDRLGPALEAERLAQTALFSTADVREGMHAFTQKRRPVFRGE